MFSFAVTERRREIGIRLALGASRGSVRGLLLRRMGGAIVAGLAVGLVLALVAGQALRSFLYGLSPSDPLSYVAVAAAVVVDRVDGDGRPDAARRQRRPDDHAAARVSARQPPPSKMRRRPP